MEFLVHSALDGVVIRNVMKRRCSVTQKCVQPPLDNELASSGSRKVDSRCVCVFQMGCF